MNIPVELSKNNSASPQLKHFFVFNNYNKRYTESETYLPYNYLNLRKNRKTQFAETCCAVFMLALLLALLPLLTRSRLLNETCNYDTQPNLPCLKL